MKSQVVLLKCQEYDREKIYEELKKGNIDVSPYEENSTSNACKWCLFKEACVFERENTQMRKTKGTKEEAWKNIVREYKESEKNG